MKKRLLILIFAAVIAIPLITMIALRSSADDVTYYNISSYQDLVNNKPHYSEPNAVFRLTQDITVTGDGSGARADFSATFDGQGHTIYNCQGAFLYLINSATFKNVTISNKTAAAGSTFTATNSVFGSIGNGDPLGTVTVENVTVTRTVSNNGASVGILFNGLWQNEDGGKVVIRDCSCTGTVTNTHEKNTTISSGGYVGAVGYRVELEFTNCDASVTFGQGTGNDSGLDRPLVGLAESPKNGVTVHVSTQSQLTAAAKTANANKVLCKKMKINLTEDLTMDGNWAPGDFYGSFDGQGHTVYNLTADSFLWPMYSATFENFTVSNKTAADGSDMTLTGTTSVFGSIGSGDCPAGNTVTVRNVHNERNVTMSKDDHLGAFFRNLAPAGTVVIENCTNSGSYNQGSKTCTLGGFAGKVGGGKIMLINCFNSGDITAATAGGLIGDAGSSACKITLVGCGVHDCTVGANAGSGSAASLVGTCSPGELTTYVLNAYSCSAVNVNVVAATARKLIGVASAEENTRPGAYNCEVTGVQKNGSASWDGNANKDLNIVGESGEGALLRTVNFHADGYDPDFMTASNADATVELLGDSSVRLTVKNEGNKRAMWGDYLVEPLPLFDGVKYTFVFDLTFGNGNVAFGLQTDGNVSLLLDGDGNIYWYSWNTKRVGASQKESENWANCTDVDKTAKQTFAVTMDYDAKTFRLYVKQSNGSFGFVRSVRYESTTWDSTRVRTQFYVRAIDTNQTPDATYTATVENLKIYKGLTHAKRYVLDTVAGAAVRLDNPTGLRFTGNIGKDYLDGLKAEYGAGNVKVGMLITPTDYLTDNSLAFTKEALDGCGALPEGKKYRKIEAATILETEDGAAYKINCVLSNVLEANYGRAFSAITYVEINGNTYYYSNYFEEDNSRSIFRVADAALLDLSDTEDGEYRYQVAYTSEYSPYTAEQRATLEGFRIPGSFTVMSYNIEVYGHGGPGWNGRDPEMAMQTVRSASPDIVGFQEVDDNWNGYFSALTSNGYTRLKGDAATDGSERVEIFYKTDKFTKVSEGTYKYKALASSLSVPNDENANQSKDTHGRIFHYAVLREIETGKKVLFINTHLHYGGTGEGHEEDDKVRRYEIRTLLAWIEDQNIDCDCTVIVGDMNSAYSGGQGKVNMALFTDAGYEITRDSAKAKGDTGGTLANNRTTRQHYVFDYVMTEGSASAMSYTAIDNKIDNGGTTYPSDHVPVMATILFD